APVHQSGLKLDLAGKLRGETQSSARSQVRSADSTPQSTVGGCKSRSGSTVQVFGHGLRLNARTSAPPTAPARPALTTDRPTVSTAFIDARSGVSRKFASRSRSP